MNQDSRIADRQADPFFDARCEDGGGARLASADASQAISAYLEAAIELASALAEKGRYGLRGRLAMPILANARHALLLALRHALAGLHRLGMVAEPPAESRDPLRHWRQLRDSRPGDRALRQRIDALAPYVASLARIDEDGSVLPHPALPDDPSGGPPAIADDAAVDPAQVRESLRGLLEEIGWLLSCVSTLGRESVGGLRTRDCSRQDLVAIARMLPSHGEWRGEAFEEASGKVRDRFGLSADAFADALEAIAGARETRALVGLTSPLVHLCDAQLLRAVRHWRRCHPNRALTFAESLLGRGLWKRDHPAVDARRQDAAAAIADLGAALAREEVAELATIFDMGRAAILPELYEARVAERREALAAEDAAPAAVDALLGSLQFARSIADGLRRLGRPDLAAQVLEEADAEG
ncbi:hypothetical protein E2493_19255 [Sphingomonas parva]|uniref:Uncharacterized protein n=1 Tax=Sphingomonas parva TaxID=2555898 RepID=A0A4Y8ZKU6_9SPHN|nr:hypothetical protein [Sphingomonas parva]TFI56623.1 hypothetical protein E2493_19255 [Sphingomonas parva]